MSKTKKQCIYIDDKRGTYYFKVNYHDFYGIPQQACRRGFKTAEEAEKAKLDFLANHANGGKISKKFLLENLGI